jgi:hypothetical protein
MEAYWNMSEQKEYIQLCVEFSPKVCVFKDSNSWELIALQSYFVSKSLVSSQY